MMELNYSNNVQKLREGRNINKAQMSRDLDISRKCILQIESGKQNVSLYLAYEISTYFGLEIQDVFPYIKKDVLAPPADYVLEVSK